MVGRDRLIEGYFHVEPAYKETIDSLQSKHCISVRSLHLKRILSRNRLGRRRWSSLDETANAIQEKPRGNGGTISY